MANSSGVPLEHLLAHRAWVRALARTLVRDEAGAEDLEQQVWVEALERPPSHGRGLRAWFATVLRRRARDAWRGESRRSAREASVARPAVGRPTAELVAEAEAQRRVVEGLLSLDERHREVLLLRFYEDLPPAAIAAREGIPRETVKTRLRRALAALRGRLEEGSGAGGAWRAALLPLAGQGGIGGNPVDPVVTGGVIMGSTTKAAVVASLAILLGVGWWSVRERADVRSPFGDAGVEDPVGVGTSPGPAPPEQASSPFPGPPAPGTTPPVETREAPVPGPPRLDRDRLPLVVAVREPSPEVERVEVEVDVRGHVTVGGVEKDMADLLALLKERADAGREEEAPMCSRVNAVLRVDRDLPWQAAQWLMQACANPAVRMDRIHFAAVSSSGGEEGVLPTFLPRDTGVRQGEVPQMIRVSLSLGDTGPAAAVRDLHPWLERRFPDLRDSRVTGEIDADPGVPAGEVLATVDALLRAGLDPVLFRGTRAFGDETLDEAIRRIQRKGTVLEIRVLGTSIVEK